MLIPPTIDRVLARLSARKGLSAVTVASIASVSRSILRAFAEVPPDRTSLVRALEKVQKCFPANAQVAGGVVVESTVVPELEVLAREIEAELARGRETAPQDSPDRESELHVHGPGTPMPPPSAEVLSAAPIAIQKVAPRMRTLPLVVLPTIAPAQPFLLRDEGEKWPVVSSRQAKRRRPRPPRVIPEPARTEWVNRLTPFAVGATVLRERDGREVVVVVVKGTFEWDAKGRVALAAEQRPLQDVDGFAGKPGASSITAPSDFTLAKPRVDVLVQGEIVFPQPVEVVDVGLQVGAARKILRVHGDRAWVMGAAGRPVPSRAVGLARMPIVWERSFGGPDPTDPSRVEPSNPIGVGFAHKISALVGTRAPNFEDPTRPVEAGASTPVGFGAVAPHWSPRRELAGTYDAQWKDHRCPLLPDDFDDRHYNVAPIDQQLDEYRPDMEMVLTNMTAATTDRFRLPRFECPLALVDAGYLVERSPRVDMIIIEPQTRNILITARLVHLPRTDVLDVKAIFAGALSRGRRRALMAGKRYREAAR